MKVKSLLHFGVVTAICLMTLLPLSAFDHYRTSPDASATAEFSESKPVYVSSELGPATLSATYKGSSGCAITNHQFDVVVDVLDASTNLYRVRNLLDEGQTLKARLKDGRLDMGRQRMGSYTVTGNIVYLENPARIETRIKYDDGVGFCEDVSAFTKR